MILLMQDNLNFNSQVHSITGLEVSEEHFCRRRPHLVFPRCQGKTNQLLNFSLWDACCHFWFGDSFTGGSTFGRTFGSNGEANFAAAGCAARSWSTFSSSWCDDWLQGLLLPHDWWQFSTSRPFSTSLHFSSPWSPALWTPTLGDFCANAINGGRCADEADAEQTTSTSALNWSSGVSKWRWTPTGSHASDDRLQRGWLGSWRQEVDQHHDDHRWHQSRAELCYVRDLDYDHVLYPGHQVQAFGWWPRCAHGRWHKDRLTKISVKHKTPRRRPNSTYRQRWFASYPLFACFCAWRFCTYGNVCDECSAWWRPTATRWFSRWWQRTLWKGCCRQRTTSERFRWTRASGTLTPSTEPEKKSQSSSWRTLELQTEDRRSTTSSTRAWCWGWRRGFGPSTRSGASIRWGSFEVPR